MTPAVRERAEQALALIRGGWTQGSSWRTKLLPDGGLLNSYCMLGANFHAACMREDRVYRELVDKLAEVIRAQYPELGSGNPRSDGVVIDFNDLPGRTKDEVIAIYEKVLAEEQ